MSNRGKEWEYFSDKVLDHIDIYTVPQYGDYPEDQLTEWSAFECLLAVKKYIARYKKNSRPGQQELDFLKMAHYVAVAYFKYMEQTNQPIPEYLEKN